MNGSIDGNDGRPDFFQVVFPVALTASLLGNSTVGVNGVYTYDWTEQEPNSQGVYANNTIPRMGTKENGPFLVEINNVQVTTLPAIVQARLRCQVNGNSYCEFQIGMSGGGGGSPSDGALGDVQFADGAGHFLNAQDLAGSSSVGYNMAIAGPNVLAWSGVNGPNSNALSPQTYLPVAINGTDLTGFFSTYQETIVHTIGSGNVSIIRQCNNLGNASTTFDYCVKFGDSAGFYMGTNTNTGLVTPLSGRMGWSVSGQDGLGSNPSGGKFWINALDLSASTQLHDFYLDVLGNATWGFNDTSHNNNLVVRKRTAVQAPLGNNTAAGNAQVGGVLFDHYADVGNATTTETDLYTDSIAANTLSANGDKLSASYSLNITSSATATTDIRVYFGGTNVFDSGALTLQTSDGPWTIQVELVRSSSTTARVTVYMLSPGATAQIASAESDMTGLSFTTSNILKITGQRGAVGAGSNQIVAKHGYVEWKPAAM